MVSIRKGPYGHYAQIDAADEEEKPKRISLTKDMVPDDIDLETAVALLAVVSGVHYLITNRRRATEQETG